MRGDFVSIEKMTMVNLIGPMDILEEVAEYVVLSKALHPVNAMDEINSNNFTISVTENNLEALIDFSYVRPYVSEEDYSKINIKIKKLEQIIEKEDDNVKDSELILDRKQLEKRLDLIVEKFENLHEQLDAYQREKEKLEEYKKNIGYLKEVNLTADELINVRNFYMQVYRISKDNFTKLESNYENISSIVMSPYKDKEHVIVVIFTPKILRNDSDRIFKSLNCKNLQMPKNYLGTPSEILKKIEDDLNKVNKEIIKTENTLKEIYAKNKKEIAIIRRSFQLKKTTLKLKEDIAHTKDFFYLCGWSPQSMLPKIRRKMEHFDPKIIIIEKNADRIQTDIIPPTKYKNNFIVQPFETMVNMYGIPTYGESDPTVFLAISYMVMFGAMFGDIGQGLVFFFAGLYLKYKKGKNNYGGILARLGISSSIFGLLYGSVFGFEDVIEPLLVRPMENIKEVLLTAIAFGSLLLIIGFLYSLVNNIKKGDLENGVFGKDGLVGLVFYVLLITFALSKINQFHIMNTNAWVILFIGLLLLMVFKQPLANLIMKKRPLYKESKNDYYIEGCFGVVETLLSMFSNTVSFIRVGAFALNHVGLFIAFASMAQMINNSFGSVFMYVLGNVVIIGLEGLIVFIQGLRLEYYELFSKYYEGSGLEFNPIGLDK
ncbi:V-type sodium ATP synthase subunit I [Clostridium tetanomorphum DSM 665]|nr:V-type sodium ATP synthase subunit I [Clostridium tetanomorphum DSM 665]KAJ50487.1 V-type sodium ATP synthase subunit I [Clostridium tetanomorphum DSM 665]